MDFRWNEWNIEHIAKHGISPEEAELAIRSARKPFPRKIEEDKWLAWGRGNGGRFLQVIFVLDLDETVYGDPCTAIERSGEAAISPQAAMKQKPYWEMTPNELAGATRQFEASMVADQSRPLTPAEREQWQRVKRKRGRPKVGQGFKRVSVSLEQGLLKHATVLAKKRHLSRSKLFAQLLEKALVEER